MTAAAIGAQARGSASRPRRLLPLVVVLIVASLVFGARYALSAQLVRNPFAKPAPAAGPVKMPTNVAIETQWGIRFTSVILLADGGLLEMRYQVLDASKASRIHSGSMKDLPLIKEEGSGKVVTSQSLMFHMKHGDTTTPGRTFSLLYGNSGGAISKHSLITIQLADGLKLQHVQVTE